MKTNIQTLNSASHRNATIANWLSSNNSLLTQLLGSNISNLSFIGVIAFTLFAFAALLLASDALQLYGWSAFCSLAALNCVISLFREFNQGGK